MPARRRGARVPSGHCFAADRAVWTGVFAAEGMQRATAWVGLKFTRHDAPEGSKVHGTLVIDICLNCTTGYTTVPSATHIVWLYIGRQPSASPSWGHAWTAFSANHVCVRWRESRSQPQPPPLCLLTQPQAKADCMSSHECKQHGWRRTTVTGMYGHRRMPAQGRPQQLATNK